MYSRNDRYKQNKNFPILFQDYLDDPRKSQIINKNDQQNSFNKDMLENGLNIKSLKKNERNHETNKNKKVDSGAGTTFYAKMKIIPDKSGQEMVDNNDETLEY